MGFFSEFSKALNGDESGERYAVAGHAVTCPHCGSHRFFESSALLDGRAGSFIGLEWAGDSAVTLICATCGHDKMVPGTNLSGDKKGPGSNLSQTSRPISPRSAGMPAISWCSGVSTPFP